MKKTIFIILALVFLAFLFKDKIMSFFKKKSTNTETPSSAASNELPTTVTKSFTADLLDKTIRNTDSVQITAHAGKIAGSLSVVEPLLVSTGKPAPSVDSFMGE